MAELTEMNFDQSVIERISQMGAEHIRDFLAYTEDLFSKFPQVEIPTAHHFSSGGSGIYAREMKMKEGELVIGKIHKYENLNILSEGEVSVLSIDGLVRVKAPHTFVASAGAKRMIYAHSPVTWTTIHGTKERDLVKLEEEFIAKAYDEVALPEAEAQKVEEIACHG